MDITLDYVPHRTQRIIHHARDRRFRTVCCGRRWGKTRFAAAEFLDIAGQSEEKKLFAWIAPTYFIAERGERALKTIAGEAVTFSGQNPRRAHFLNAELLLLSADSPDTILGEGYDGVIVDEAARIPGGVWQMNIRPALADKRGWAIFISTPTGRNWFYDIHKRGKDPAPTNQYASFTFTSKDNPYFPPEEWDEAKISTPQDIFRQEYEAEFLEDTAGVFRNVEGCLDPRAELPQHGNVVVGCDLAKYTDFTWLIAMDATTGNCLAQERFNQIDWPVQKELIMQFSRKWRGPVIMDGTGVGDPICDDLAASGVNIVPVKLSQHSKAQLIQRLAVAVEQNRIHWPRAWETLTDELRRYEYKIMSNGGFTYSAPSGFHDDGVIALALANSRRLDYVSYAMPIALPRHIGPQNRPLRPSVRQLA